MGRSGKKRGKPRWRGECDGGRSREIMAELYRQRSELCFGESEREKERERERERVRYRLGGGDFCDRSRARRTMGMLIYRERRELVRDIVENATVNYPETLTGALVSSLVWHLRWEEDAIAKADVQGGEIVAVIPERGETRILNDRAAGILLRFCSANGDN